MAGPESAPGPISREYTYDAENQLVSVRDETGVTVSFTYDKAGNRTAVTVSGGTRMPAEAAVPPGTHHTPPVCRGCGQPLAPGKKFCSSCGTPVPSE